MSTPTEPSDDARERALTLAPRLLIALAGACTVSGAVGVVLIATGRGAPPIPWLLAPPALVLLAASIWFVRARGEEVR